METPQSSSLLLVLLPILALLLSASCPASALPQHHHFTHCLFLFTNSTSISKVIYTPANTSYASILRFPVANQRFLQPTTPRPQVIVTPLLESHIQAAVVCSKRHGLEVRVRSGGHDYEGLSYVSKVPFVVIDLFRFRSITVDVDTRTAWAQTGSTNGEIYYNIAKKSKTLGFTAGVCPTVGSGGHISGGGWGFMMRKYGLAIDNILDARFVDAKGRILNRKTMGEDLFWAIRGGGGGSFGIVVAWKLNLVPVPSTVTVFEVDRTSDQNVTKLVNRWQHVANKLPHEIVLRIAITTVNSTSADGTNRPTIQAKFRCLYLGRQNMLLALMQEKFPELGVVKEDCKEMSWIESVIFLSEFGNGNALEDLLNRTPPFKVFSKGKSDYAQQPIPEAVFDNIWKRFHEMEVGAPSLFLTPYGGRLSEIPASSTPFPHRAGTLYKLNYVVNWQREGSEPLKQHMGWIRKLYKYMQPYVSKSPRAAYVNYRDLDIGMNGEGNTSYRRASVWGLKYYANNFKRLVYVKTKVDPGNFFRHEQSIPPQLMCVDDGVWNRRIATSLCRRCRIAARDDQE